MNFSTLLVSRSEYSRDNGFIFQKIELRLKYKRENKIQRARSELPKY